MIQNQPGCLISQGQFYSAKFPLSSFQVPCQFWSHHGDRDTRHKTGKNYKRIRDKHTVSLSLFYLKRILARYWFMPLIPQLRRLRQECLEFQASLGNPMRP
jgi:hypothetical protein